jgi:cellulose synthase/poly-beta-1,6-N-acetylglucosamine synthase-like glycosyltransferase
VKIVFWLSLAGIVYAYAGYPVVIWLLARLSPRAWKSAPLSPSVSIVLAVHNGAALLPGKIQHLLSLDYTNIHEIIFVSDRSLHNPLIKTIVLAEHGGKAVAVNAGVAAATGEVILFVDIRPEIAPGAIQHLVNNFADPKVGCVAGELKLHQRNHDATSAAVGGLYWRYEQWIRKCESAFDSPVGVYGGFYAIRNSLAITQPAGMILDDMFQPLSIIRQGYRSVIDEAAVVYDMWPEKMEGEFHRKVRTLAGNFQLVQLAPWTLTAQNRVVFQFVSHKLMRLGVPWLTLLLLASTLALAVNSRMYAACASVEALALAIAILGLRPIVPVLHRIAAPAGALLVLNAAAVVGLYKFLTTRGPLWKIWNASTPRPALETCAPDGQARALFIEESMPFSAGNGSRDNQQQRVEEKAIVR